MDSFNTCLRARFSLFGEPCRLVDAMQSVCNLCTAIPESAQILLFRLFSLILASSLDSPSLLYLSGTCDCVKGSLLTCGFDTGSAHTFAEDYNDIASLVKDCNPTRLATPTGNFKFRKKHGNSHISPHFSRRNCVFKLFVRGLKVSIDTLMKVVCGCNQWIFKNCRKTFWTTFQSGLQ